MDSRVPACTAAVLGASALCGVSLPAWSTERGLPAKLPAPIAMTPDAEWCLQPLPQPLAAFRGLEAADPNAVGSGSMLYPAPTVGVLLAEIAAHSTFVGGVRAKHAREHAEAANQVLEPYQAVLGGFKSQELEDRTLDARTPDGAKSLACAANHTASAWSIDSAPVFFMTQDQTALVLDNVVALHPPGKPSTTAHRSTVRVVSLRLSANTPAAIWMADDGAQLKTESVVLFGQSLDIALRVAAGDPLPSGAPFKSFHYYEGGSEKVERAQLVAETCERLLLKTLRAAFLSVPTLRTDCASDGQTQASGPAPVPKQDSSTGSPHQ